MGLDLTAYSGLKAEPAVARKDAFKRGLLAFYEDEVTGHGFDGMDLLVGYSYDDLLEQPMGSFRGVSAFFTVLAEMSGAPGDVLDPEYQGPFRHLFQAREWLGPADCVTIAAQLEGLNGKWTTKLLAKHEWKTELFAEYYEQWRSVFLFAGSNGVINFH